LVIIFHVLSLYANVLYGMIERRGRIFLERCEKGNPVVRRVCAKPRASLLGR
jgi:hypothetical protein